MIKVGFVDAWLDEWHAKMYPDFLREAAKKSGIHAEITLAYAEKDLPGSKLTTDAWCETFHVARANSLEQLIAETDALFVLAPDDSSLHEELAKLPLQTGKPVYVDKTFAPDLVTGKRMFALAKRSGTPVFSCSAQRFCKSILDYQFAHPDIPSFCATTGPGEISNYSVHQLEMMNTLMGNGFLRAKAFPVGVVSHVIFDYGNGRIATFTQNPTPQLDPIFHLVVSDGTDGYTLECTDYYIHFMKSVLQFYVDKKPPVAEESTLEVLSMIDTIRAARQKPDEWVDAVR